MPVRLQGISEDKYHNTTLQQKSSHILLSKFRHVDQLLQGQYVHLIDCGKMYIWLCKVSMYVIQKCTSALLRRCSCTLHTIMYYIMWLAKATDQSMVGGGTIRQTVPGGQTHWRHYRGDLKRVCKEEFSHYYTLHSLPGTEHIWNTTLWHWHAHIWTIWVNEQYLRVLYTLENICHNRGYIMAT